MGTGLCAPFVAIHMGAVGVAAVGERVLWGNSTAHHAEFRSGGNVGIGTECWQE